MTSVGDYDLEHQIGAGASGTVWKAHQRGPVARVVALKRLRAGGGAADLARMRREATVLTELDHPHVVRVLEVLHDGDGVAIAMQFAPGGSLADLLAERGRLTPGQVVAVAAPVADALASAHRRGVLHGDVKPANILFTSDGEPLLGDFGVARTLGLVTSDQIVRHGRVPGPRAPGRGPARPARRRLLAGGRLLPGPDRAPALLRRGAAGGGRAPRTPGCTIASRTSPGSPSPSLGSSSRPSSGIRPGASPRPTRWPGHCGPPCLRVTSGCRGRPPWVGWRSTATPGAGLTTTFGPRPPRPEADTPGRSWRVPVALVGVGLLAAGGIALLRGPLSSGDDEADADCPGSGAVDRGATAQVVRGDVDGEGCTVAGVYQPQALPNGTTGMVLTIPIGGVDKQIGLGEAGDQVVLGDWNCDGVDTPALYRRAAGQVQYFDVWPSVEQRSYEPDAVEDVAAGGEATLEEGSGDDRDCDRARVTTSQSGDSGAGEAQVTASVVAATPTGQVRVGHHGGRW